jgi:outer membrane cobalamin receptor
VLLIRPLVAVILLAGIFPGRALAQGTLSGTIYDADDGQPLAHAVVRLILQTRAAGTGDHDTAIGAQGTVADEQGRYVIASLPPGTWSVEASLVGYRTRRLDGVIIADNTDSRLDFRLNPKPIALRETVVTPGRFVIIKDDPTTAQRLTREEIHSIPQLGEDIYQAIKRLPGVSSKDYSARFTVRGGEHEEVLVLLDGLQVYEPFHLKDIGGGALSIVDVMAIGGIDMMTGGFPARYGNHMSGVLDIASTTPASKRRTSLGISLMNARYLTEGELDNGRGSWLLSARRGYLDFVMRIVNQSDISPTYYDVLGKVEYRLTDQHVLSAHVLHAGDHLEAAADDDRLESRYGNSYGWLRLRSSLAPTLSSESVLSLGRVTRQRFAEDYSSVWEANGQRIIDSRLDFDLDEDRHFTVVGLRQDWNWEASEQALVTSGFDLKRLDSTYDYYNQRWAFDADTDGTAYSRYDTLQVLRHPDSTELGLHAAARFRPLPRVTAEVGLRYDHVGHTGDDDLSPRLSVALDLAGRTVMRAAWGYYRQGQDISDLDVPYGDASVYPSQRAEHRVVGLEHQLGSGLHLRVEAYQKLLTRIRPRYENLSRDVLFAPELSETSVFLEPDRGEARGLEVYLRRDTGGRITWWASYALARAQEEYGDDVVARNEDQRHTFYFDGNYRPNSKWRLNVAWQYRSGWPFTERIFVRTDVPEGEWPFRDGFGERNAVRLPAYHRLDIRVNRYFDVGRGQLSVFAEIINAYDRMNVQDIRPGDRRQIIDGELVAVTTRKDEFLPLLPSLGVSYEF